MINKLELFEYVKINYRATGYENSLFFFFFSLSNNDTNKILWQLVSLSCKPSQSAEGKKKKVANIQLKCLRDV